MDLRIKDKVYLVTGGGSGIPFDIVTGTSIGSVTAAYPLRWPVRARFR